MSRRQVFFLFLLPAVLVLLMVSVFPLIEAVNLSLHNRVLRYPTARFIGLQNFSKLAGDRRFWNSLKISFIWEGVTVSGSLLLGIALALALYKKMGDKLKAILTLALILPVVLPRVSAAYVWRLMYSPVLGVFNYFLGLVGIGPVEFLSNRYLALFSVAVIDIWQWGLLLAVLILNLLESLPKEPTEAALIDGVGPWQLHRYITLPMVVPQIVSLTFVKMVESLRSFDLIYVLTKGGPGIATETLDLYAYQTGIGISGRISYASCISLLMLIATVAFMTAIWKVYKKWSFA